MLAARHVDPGDLATPAKALLTVEDRSRFRVLFDVPQRDLRSLRIGAPVRVDGVASPLEVSRLHPSMSESGTLTVEAWAPADSPLVPGSTPSVSVELSRLEDAVLVPEVALVDDPSGGVAVFLLTEGRTAARPVRVRLARGGLAAVEGLDPGTPVVVSTYLGFNRLSAGEPVEVRP